jgi:carbon monoxide dehydrogenase subunit G
MFTVSGDILIQRPIEDVFAYLADFENDRRWRSEVTEARRLPGPESGLGERYVEAMHFPGFRVRSEFEIIEFEPPRIITAEGRSEGMHAVQHYELTTEDGATRVHIATRLDTQGLLAMGEPIAARLLNGRARENIRRLKRRLETERRL